MPEPRRSFELQFEGFSDSEAAEFFPVLLNDPNVEEAVFQKRCVSEGQRERLSKAMFGVYVPVGQVIIASLAPAVAYAGKKLVDVFAEVLKDWLLRQKGCQHRTVVIYAPDGSAARIVECDAGKTCGRRSLAAESAQ